MENEYSKTIYNEEKNFHMYLKLAEEENHKGQFNLGFCYQNGIGTTKDEEKAFRWYLKSAEGGNSDGQCRLGYCYENGIGTTKDEEKAFQWYLKSAEGGNSYGQNNLGYCYENGIGTTKYEVKAFRWYLKSAEGGNSGEQCNLGYCYRNGIGTTKDEEKAFRWYLKSAEGGNHTGQGNLGYYEEKAFQWYLKSAEGGNSYGQNNLGYCYEKGIGTAKDGEKAFKWYLKSAEGGNHMGQNNLGYCYRNGIGTTKEEEKAFRWYLKSAEGGEKYGLTSIEYSYRNEIGISNFKKNQKKSKRRCNNCENSNILNNTCLDCKFIEIPKWTSGNSEVDKIIHMTQSDDNADQWEIWRWIDYSKLKNIEYLAEGGFGSIWKAEWIDMSEEVFEFYKSNQVALKKLKNSQEISSEFLKEKAFRWYLKSAEGGEKYGLTSIEYSYRNEIGISNFKKNQKKSKRRCNNCENSNILNNTCLDCKFIEIPKWTSGNSEVDKIIHMTQSDDNADQWEIWRWIDYSKLKNIEYLAEGGFGSIWKAEWIDMSEEVFEFYKSNQVALKKLKNSQEISSEFLKELTANFQCRNKYVLPILGITQDSMTKEYAIVLRHMKNGNLRDFLKQNKSLPWIERIWLLNSFIKGLKVIHSKGFVHRDLHPGNLMITEAYNNSKYKFIRLGDLGLCRLANENSSSREYGVLPYIAPEVLNKYQYTQASDIYSVGIIMWIISTGKIPFAIRAYDSELAETKDPSKRPSAEIIYDISENWIEDLMYDKKTEYSLIFLNADQKIHDESEDEDLSSAETTHPEANITSKPIPSSFKNFNIENLNFDSC
ncbi:hypothetical protein Glove_633g5 [Diversispora epigaea]|uniref:Protein kinase domain-containing protein n=1 Tax=Diversispora epigaea TaxID=1348612 RepID=A0A397GDG5_9GLOM|nr:hypothetical protein Glove_633g5 [Diversispora epigaea]